MNLLTFLTASENERLCATLATGLALTLATISSIHAQTPAPAEKTPPIDAGAGRIAWFDITTPDLSAAKNFYGKLFGWTFKPTPGSEFAVEISAGSARIGTIRVAEGKLSPFNGMVYVQVSDVAASCEKAKELGATVPPGFPFDLPEGGGTVGVAVDPLGHPIGLYSPPGRKAAAPAK